MSESTKRKIKVLALENISVAAIERFKSVGFEVEVIKTAISESELMKKIENVDAIGIRSKTKLSDKVLECAKKLMVVGCFCIGTNQVDVEFAAMKGIPVFNSPFSNGRSVAELVLCEIIALSRQLGLRNNEMHACSWIKSSKDCHEIRGKVLGIVGYGHIGSQLSVLAEGLGMRVLFYDILNMMPLGNAQAVSFDTLLAKSDFVTLHVPATELTDQMINEKRIKSMKSGSILINASRGSVVDISAAKEALMSGHLAGAAFDVYPKEPKANGEFSTGLEGLRNVILTPHIGGCTEEAQVQIGLEVANHIINFVQRGSTRGSVNMPSVMIESPSSDCKRILNYHHNVPGVLKQINSILCEYNIEKQISESRGRISFFVTDIKDADDEICGGIIKKLERIPESIVTRLVQ